MGSAWISSHEVQRLRAIALEDVLERWALGPTPTTRPNGMARGARSRSAA